MEELFTKISACHPTHSQIVPGKREGRAGGEMGVSKHMEKGTRGWRHACTCKYTYHVDNT